MAEKTRRGDHGFTMLELLTTIALMTMLLGILLPALQSALETARRSACANHMRQVGLGALNFHDANGALPAGYTLDRVRGTPQGHSVFYHLLPFLDETTVFDQMNPKVPSENISTVPGIRAAAVVPVLVCPTDVFADGNPRRAADGPYFGATSYRANGGSRPLAAAEATNDGTFMCTGSLARRAATAPPGQAIAMKHITDGVSKTLLFAESAHVDRNFDSFTVLDLGGGEAIASWSKWYPAGDDTGMGNVLCGAFAPVMYTTPFRHGEPGAPTSAEAWAVHHDRRIGAIGSLHRMGANGVFADGSVRLLEETMDRAILELVCRRADGQSIPDLP